MAELKLLELPKKFEDLPVPSKISMVCSDGQWWLTFYLDDVYTFTQALHKTTEKIREEIASLFNVQMKQTKVKIPNLTDSYEFNLFKRENKVMCVVQVHNFQMGHIPPFGDQFVFEIPNPQAIPAKSLEEGCIKFNDRAVKHRHYE